MYLSFYQLDAKPFQITTDPEFLWFSEKHKESLAMLQYGIMENKGCLLLTGDVGTGKTTLINALKESLGDDVVMAVIYDPHLETIDFFNHLSAAFDLNMRFDTKGAFIRHFTNFLNTTFVKNKKVLLVVDEAQRMTPEILEELRNLSNIEKHYTKLINIFFVGQNEFINMLKGPECRALRQRMTISYHIPPLTQGETGEYIRHRLKVAGAKGKIFNSGAIDEVYRFSKGYPRLINIICDLALVSGFVEEAKTIRRGIITECAGNLQIHTDFGTHLVDSQSEASTPETTQPETSMSVATQPEASPPGPLPPGQPEAGAPPREKRSASWALAFAGLFILTVAAVGFIVYWK